MLFPSRSNVARYASGLSIKRMPKEQFALGSALHLGKKLHLMTLNYDGMHDGLHFMTVIHAEMHDGLQQLHISASSIESSKNTHIICYGASCVTPISITAVVTL